MSEFTALRHRTFTDKKFRKLSIESKLLFLYLLSNSDITVTGIYEVNPEIVSLILGLTSDFNKCMSEITEQKMVHWDEKNEIVWIVNRFKFHLGHSPKLILSAIKELNELNHPFKQMFIKQYDDLIKPYAVYLSGYKVTNEDLLTPEQVISLSKIYEDKKGLKRFLLNRGCSEQRIDQVISEVVPYLKEKHEKS